MLSCLLVARKENLTGVSTGLTASRRISTRPVTRPVTRPASHPDRFPSLPYAKMVRHLLGLHLYLGGRCNENPQSTRGPTQCKSGPSNNMLVSRSNYLLYQFSITISFNSPVFTQKNTFKKITRGKCSLNKLLSLNGGVWALMAVLALLYLLYLFSWQNENL